VMKASWMPSAARRSADVNGQDRGRPKLSRSIRRSPDPERKVIKGNRRSDSSHAGDSTHPAWIVAPEGAVVNDGSFDSAGLRGTARCSIVRGPQCETITMTWRTGTITKKGDTRSGDP